MTFLQFKKITRWSVFRVALLGIMEIITLLFPKFSGGDIIYAIAAYAILNGALDIINFLSSKSNEEKLIAYLNLL